MSNRNALARGPVQGPQNMLGQPNGMQPGMPQQGMPQQGMPQQGMPGMPSQEMLDDLWRQQPTDSIGAQIEQIVRNSGGALMAPWDRQQQPANPSFEGGAPNMGFGAPRY